MNPVAQTVRNLIGRVMLGVTPAQHEFADTMTEVIYRISLIVP